jgi:hypothetical protein
MHMCECGRPALSIPKNLSANSSRKARNGKPRFLKGHDLCARCQDKVMDRFQAERKKEKAADWREKHRRKYAAEVA